MKNQILEFESQWKMVNEKSNSFLSIEEALLLLQTA